MKPRDVPFPGPGRAYFREGRFFSGLWAKFSGSSPIRPESYKSGSGPIRKFWTRPRTGLWGLKPILDERGRDLRKFMPGRDGAEDLVLFATLRDNDDEQEKMKSHKFNEALSSLSFSVFFLSIDIDIGSFSCLPATTSSSPLPLPRCFGSFVLEVLKHRSHSYEAKKKSKRSERKRKGRLCHHLFLLASIHRRRHRRWWW